MHGTPEFDSPERTALMENRRFGGDSIVEELEEEAQVKAKSGGFSSFLSRLAVILHLKKKRIDEGAVGGDANRVTSNPETAATKANAGAVRSNTLSAALTTLRKKLFPHRTRKPRSKIRMKGAEDGSIDIDAIKDAPARRPDQAPLPSTVVGSNSDDLKIQNYHKDSEEVAHGSLYEFMDKPGSFAGQSARGYSMISYGGDYELAGKGRLPSSRGNIPSKGELRGQFRNLLDKKSSNQDLRKQRSPNPTTRVTKEGEGVTPVPMTTITSTSEHSEDRISEIKRTSLGMKKGKIRDSNSGKEESDRGKGRVLSEYDENHLRKKRTVVGKELKKNKDPLLKSSRKPADDSATMFSILKPTLRPDEAQNLNLGREVAMSTKTDFEPDLGSEEGEDEDFSLTNLLRPNKQKAKQLMKPEVTPSLTQFMKPPENSHNRKVSRMEELEDMMPPPTTSKSKTKKVSANSNSSRNTSVPKISTLPRPTKAKAAVKVQTDEIALPPPTQPKDRIGSTTVFGILSSAHRNPKSTPGTGGDPGEVARRISNVGGEGSMTYTSVQQTSSSNFLGSPFSLLSSNRRRQKEEIEDPTKGVSVNSDML